jgi:hypothetical protein
VVIPKLQAYRRRGTWKAVAKAARLRLTTVKGWRNDPALRKRLEEAVEAARQGKKADSEAFRRLSTRKQEGMIRYGQCATKAARCRDKTVDIDTTEIDHQLHEADARGVGQALREYLDHKGPYKKVKYRRHHGLIEGNLFIIPPDMYAFHEVAVKEWAKQEISGLEYLPGFDAWFAAWVTPVHRKQRARTPANAILKVSGSAAPRPQTNGSGADGHDGQEDQQ